MRITYANVVATLALILAAGGTYAVAAGSAAKRPGVAACYDKQTRVITVRKAGKGCGKGKAAVRLARTKDLPAVTTGPAGPQGPQGIQGVPGPATGPAGGALAGSYPDPTLAPPEPLTLSYTSAHPAVFYTCTKIGGGTDSCGWTTESPDTQPFGWWKDSLGVVHLQGLLCIKGFGLPDCSTLGFTGDTAGAQRRIATLQAGYRPAKTLIAAAATNGGGGGSIEIRADGQVFAKTFSVNVGKQTLGLDGITFRAAD